MIVRNNLIVLSEFESVPYEQLKLTEEALVELKRQIQDINNKLNTNIIKLFWNKLSTTQYVGLIKLKKYTIQIIPKIYDSNDSKNLEFLTFMIEYLNKQIISFKSLDKGLLDTVKGNLFEYYILLFLKNLRGLILNNIYKSYQKQEDNSSKLRGKILQTLQIKHNYHKKWKFYCQFDELTINNIYNQIIKFTLILLKGQAQMLITKRLINEILSFFNDVSFKHISIDDFKTLLYDRMNIKYKTVIDFCKLIINQSTIRLNPWNFESFYFLFDMNRLFESFLSEFINRNKLHLRVNKRYSITDVKIQYRIGKLFNLFSLICDLVIDYEKNNKKNRLLLDFKYKILSSEKQNLGISQSDFYQMFSYSQSATEKTNDIILLYPKSELESTNFNDKYEHIINSNEKINIYIKSLDLEKIFRSVDETERKHQLLNSLLEIFDIE